VNWLPEQISPSQSAGDARPESSNLRRTGYGASVTQTAACLQRRHKKKKKKKKKEAEEEEEEHEGEEEKQKIDTGDENNRTMIHVTSGAHKGSVAQSEACCRPPCVCENSSAGNGEARLAGQRAADSSRGSSVGCVRALATWEAWQIELSRQTCSSSRIAVSGRIALLSCVV
jgi:hypothetical protein